MVGTGHNRRWTPVRISRLMREGNLTDIQLAVKAGVSQRTVQDWLENTRRIRKKACRKLEALEKRYGLSLA